MTSIIQKFLSFRDAIKGSRDEKESIDMAIEVLAGIDNVEGCTPPQVCYPILSAEQTTPGMLPQIISRADYPRYITPSYLSS